MGKSTALCHHRGMLDILCSVMEQDNLSALVDQRYRFMAACPPGYFIL
jgi:hypothetical protein